VPLLAACYSYTPLVTAPAPETQLALELSDQGRVGAAQFMGPSVARVEGTLLAVTDTAYVVSVREVQGLFGARTRWSGEQVSIRRDYVATALERRFSKARTGVLGVGLTSAFVALVAGVNLVVNGGGGDMGGNPPDGGGQQ
jgi:hypothetical protein